MIENEGRGKSYHTGEFIHYLIFRQLLHESFHGICSNLLVVCVKTDFHLPSVVILVSYSLFRVMMTLVWFSVYLHVSMTASCGLTHRCKNDHSDIESIRHLCSILLSLLFNPTDF